MAIVTPSTRKVVNGEYAIAVVRDTAYIGKITTNYRSSMTITGYAAEISEPLRKFLTEEKPETCAFFTGKKGEMEGSGLLVGTLLKNCRHASSRINEEDVKDTMSEEQYMTVLMHFQHHPDRYYHLS